MTLFCKTQKRQHRDRDAFGICESQRAGQIADFPAITSTWRHRPAAHSYQTLVAHSAFCRSAHMQEHQRALRIDHSWRCRAYILHTRATALRKRCCPSPTPDFRLRDQRWFPSLPALHLGSLLDKTQDNLIEEKKKKKKREITRSPDCPVMAQKHHLKGEASG